MVKINTPSGPKGDVPKVVRIRRPIRLWGDYKSKIVRAINNRMVMMGKWLEGHPISYSWFDAHNGQMCQYHYSNSKPYYYEFNHITFKILRRGEK